MLTVVDPLEGRALRGPLCAPVARTSVEQADHPARSFLAISRRPVYFHGRMGRFALIPAVLGDFALLRLTSLTVDAHADLRSADRGALPTGR